MKKMFYGSCVFIMLMGLNLKAEVVNLPEVSDQCPDTEIAYLTNVTGHTFMEGKATINAGWDSDKYMFTPGVEGLVKIHYLADYPISVKIDTVCGGSSLYRKADEKAIKEGSIDIPVTATDTIHIGTWDWESGSGYPYTLNIEIIPSEGTAEGSEETGSSDGTDNTVADVVVYEDAEDGNINGWVNISPYIGTISNVAMGDNRVIKLSGTTDSHKNRASYSFGENWNNTKDFIAKWDMQSDTDYEVFFIAKSSDDPTIVNYIGYVNQVPVLNGYTFDPSTGYWSEDATGDTLKSWGRYVYTPIDDTHEMTTITRDLKEDASVLDGVELTSIESMWVNVYGDSTKSVILDNITLQATQAPVENHIPHAEDQNITVNEGESVTITLTGTDSDGDNLVYEIVTQPAQGDLSGEAPNIVYTANSVDENTTDTFIFKVKDNQNESNIATVTVAIIDVSENNNETNTTGQVINIDENGSIDFNCAGQMIDTPELNQSVEIHGTLSGQWDNDQYSFVMPQEGAGTLQATAVDSDGNLLKVQVIRNCFRPLPKSDTGYPVGGADCHLVTVVVYGCAKDEDVAYTLTLKMTE